VISGFTHQQNKQYDRYANMGGPMSRTRNERIKSTILGNKKGQIQCPRVIRLGIDFGRKSPLKALGELMAAEGFSSPEDLRLEYMLPPGRLICRPLSGNFKRLVLGETPPYNILEHALMLGLCTSQIFDPERPVIWTETSVTRCLELFDPAGFYA